MPLERGGSIGQYQALFRLGSGGMGEVWKGRDTTSGHDVAIKVLNQDAARDQDRVRRFVMEARAASALKHPNILAVYDVGQSDAGPYIVMEYVDGDTVRSLLNTGSLPLSQALDVATQAADGVAYAHASGIVHRDLKPENLMVARNGAVKILDFGLAKLLHPEGTGDTAHTAVGMVVGSASYLSPEQLRGGKASERSDVFALGVVLYEMATGANPFQRNNAADTFSAILLDEPPPLTSRLGNVPEELSHIVDKALAKKPEARHTSAKELAADLRSVRPPVAGEPEGERPQEVLAVPARHRLTGIVFAGILAVAIVGLLVLRGC